MEARSPTILAPSWIAGSLEILLYIRMNEKKRDWRLRSLAGFRRSSWESQGFYVEECCAYASAPMNYALWVDDNYDDSGNYSIPV